MRTQNPFPPRSIWHILFLLLFLLISSLIPNGNVWADDQGNNTVTVPQVDWLEPRGLAIADLVGLVPEEHLRDAIITSRVGVGISQYISGQRNGNTVTVNVRIGQRHWTDGTNYATIFGCLGKPALDDEWVVAVAPSTMRVFEDGNDVTQEILPRNLDYIPASQRLPDNGGDGWWRYEFLWDQAVDFTDDGAINVPANMGCEFVLSGRRGVLTAEFTFQSQPYISIDVLGSETFNFHSYIGGGNAGVMADLNSQMRSRYGNRHDKFDLHPPEGADYVLVKYPPTPVDPYTGYPAVDVARPTSGSYRINGPGTMLSVDHVNSMAIPLYGHWQDADMGGDDYLTFFSSPNRIASPEYFVPAGVAYDPCMVNGSCSNELLEQIYNTEMAMTIYYYRINRTAEGLNKLPIKQVGPQWSANRAMTQRPAQLDPTLDQLGAALATAAPPRQDDATVYLPLISTAPPAPVVLPDGDNSTCPCGWFDGYGRMFDYVPGP